MRSHRVTKLSTPPKCNVDRVSVATVMVEPSAGKRALPNERHSAVPVTLSQSQPFDLRLTERCLRCSPPPSWIAVYLRTAGRALRRRKVKCVNLGLNAQVRASQGLLSQSTRRLPASLSVSPSVSRSLHPSPPPGGSDRRAPTHKGSADRGGTWEIWRCLDGALDRRGRRIENIRCVEVIHVSVLRPGSPT